MRSPSAKVLKNTADIFISSPGRDIDAGVQFNYPLTPTLISRKCTAQPQSFGEEIGEDGRITQVVEWKLIFGHFVSVSPRDKIIVQDDGGVSHTMFVEASRDEAGRGAAFTIRAIERI